MYLPNLKRHPGAETVAICGRDRDRANELASKYGIACVFTDYRAIIENADLDAIIVVTPDDLHYPITMAALDARLHVLCEKPLALSAAHARAMFEKAEAAGVTHMVMFTWRWLPHVQHMKRLIEEGYVGRCFHSQFNFLGSYGCDGQYAWRFDGRRSNGILGDLGSHMIDLARWLVGDIKCVSAQVAMHVDRPGADGQPLDPANDSAVVALEFANGAHGIIQVSAVAHVADHTMEQHIRLDGESGRLELDFPFAGADATRVIRGARHGETQLQTLPISDQPAQQAVFAGPLPAYFGEWFATQPVGVRLFIDAVLEERPVSPNFYDGLKVQEVIDAALESHRSGCRVTLAA
jgi:predicted dehydrogenase